ncbi:MAG TPA: hypothetical protein VF808_18570 [Ktedonobacterales bacterium]
MATRNTRASAGRETRDEARETPRAPARASTSVSARTAPKATTPKAAAPKPVNPKSAAPKTAAPKRGAVVTMRLAAAPGGRDATPRPEPREPAAPAAPRRPGGARKQFTELRAALASGFEIVQPVFARPLWSAADDSLTAYSFVLRRESATRLVTVPGGRLVERFIATHRLSVDERH